VAQPRQRQFVEYYTSVAVNTDFSQLTTSEAVTWQIKVCPVRYSPLWWHVNHKRFLWSQQPPDPLSVAPL